MGDRIKTLTCLISNCDKCNPNNCPTMPTHKPYKVIGFIPDKGIVSIMGPIILIDITTEHNAHIIIELWQNGRLITDLNLDGDWMPIDETDIFDVV